MDKALEHHNKALELDEQIDNKKGMIRDCEKLAKILEYKRDINKSRKYAARAQDLEFDLQSTDTNYYKLP